MAAVGTFGKNLEKQSSWQTKPDQNPPHIRIDRIRLAPISSQRIALPEQGPYQNGMDTRQRPGGVSLRANRQPEP